jgi:hypothetical protein
LCLQAQANKRAADELRKQAEAEAAAKASEYHADLADTFAEDDKAKSDEDAALQVYYRLRREERSALAARREERRAAFAPETTLGPQGTLFDAAQKVPGSFHHLKFFLPQKPKVATWHAL